MEKCFFVHMEFGYSLGIKDHIVPDPEWSGPQNTQVLDDIDAQVLPGVVERATMEVLRIMRDCGAKGMLLVFPHFAEKHGGLLEAALSQGHIIGVHMHEDWKDTTSRMTIERLTAYIGSEKARVETAIGSKVSIFSYGPGIQLDDMRGREPPPRYGSLTDMEKAKSFEAVSKAGFEYIQAPIEYRRFLPSNLKTLASCFELVGLPHSYEWHTRDRVIREVMDSINDRMRGKTDEGRV